MSGELKKIEVAKRSALTLGTVGFLVVVWFYLGPVNGVWTPNFLFSLCPHCPNITNVGGDPSTRYLRPVLVLGSLNALLYATAGFLLGKLLTKARAAQK